jgi:rubrerythrin
MAVAAESVRHALHVAVRVFIAPRGRGLYEKIILRVFGRTFYRCNQCGVWFYTKRGKQPIS